MHSCGVPGLLVGLRRRRRPKPPPPVPSQSSWRGQEGQEEMLDRAQRGTWIFPLFDFKNYCVLTSQQCHETLWNPAAESVLTYKTIMFSHIANFFCNHYFFLKKLRWLSLSPWRGADWSLERYAGWCRGRSARRSWDSNLKFILKIFRHLYVKTLFFR